MRVAIVDDDKSYSGLLQGYVKRFSKEEDCRIDASVFGSGLDLVSDYTADYDVIFLDIEMPFMDGLTAAKKIRAVDDYVSIVFVTNMAQYAIRGYEVNAVDFVVKPVEYFNFADKLKKALKFAERRTEKDIVLVREDGVVRLPVSNIYYIEKEKNYLVYHAKQGIYRSRGTMTDAEKEFAGTSFSRCSSGCLVNLKYVTTTTQNTVAVNGEELPVSRNRRKDFITDLIKYLGGAN